jgi:ferredoxin-NADP reductase/MOSC domain-containing protein YiiM/ferredoxin
MGRLVAVNIGLPRDVAWRGQVVRTGIWKQSAAGPQMVRRLNIDGDGQGDRAGHGGEQRAVLVYQLDSYRHWQAELGVDDFVHGQFGENFTVDGLPDDEVCIGDRYRIGVAVFEVTQPRVTCYRLGIRMSEPRMAALLVAHGRPGFYMRVITEGTVAAGDEIVKVASGPEAMTVADIDALLYRASHPPREQLARAVRIPALSPGWQDSFRALLEAAESGRAATGNAGLTALATVPPPAWTGFRPFVVTGVDAESRTVTSYRLGSVDGSPVPAALPGQFLTLRLQPGGVLAPLIRTYSLSGPPGDADYRISVKREPLGAGSRYLHDEVRVGQMIDVAAPRGTFTLRQGDNPIVLASAGVGATPMLAMLHALATQRSQRRIWWLHSARNRAEHAFAAEARGLLARLPLADVEVLYSAPDEGDRLGDDYTTRGRLSMEVLGGLALPADAEVYVCGPAGYMNHVTTLMRDVGIDPRRIYSEPFGAHDTVAPGVIGQTVVTPHPPTDPSGNGPSVAFARSNLSVNWDKRYSSLLEFAEACAVPVQWSCRTGVCHTCETSVLSGSVVYLPDPITPASDGSVLICCAQPRDDIVLDL